ncbi:serine hydrolase [Allocoleopsis sp.]|uniref:serine hydrolase n=1 Tax=Allocoleopsis sp. TaxID=3088169 RepID=UPI002FCFD14A
MAASIGNRGQSENPEAEQQEQRIQRQRRERRSLRKQLFGQEVARIPSPQPPKRSFGRAMRRRQQTASTSMRPIPEPPRPLLPPQQQRLKSPSPIHSSVQSLRPVSPITPQRPPTVTHGSTRIQSSDPKNYRTQESGYRRGEQTSNSSARINPWQVKPPSTISPRSSLPTTNSPTPKSLDASPRGKGRDRTVPALRAIRSAVSALPALNLLRDSGKRRRDNNPSQTVTNVASPVQEGKANGRRVKQKVASPTSRIQTNPTAKRPPRQKRPTHPLAYIIRLLILGIGIGAIAGTLLSALDPAMQVSSVKSPESAKSQAQESPKPVSQPTPLALSQEILPLKSQVQALAANNPKLQPGVFIVDLDTGAYIDINSRSTFASASTIKLPILVALFQDVDTGKIRLDESLTLQSEMIASGSGDLQYQKPGTKFTVLELATKMITISDNTATNMLISRLGGTEALTRRFRAWNLTTTVIQNPLPDLEGTNVTSPQELAGLMSMINQGQLVSLPSRDRILSIMQHNEINTLLPQGLGSGAVIAHKTGNIGSVLADVGLVNMPSGKSYIISVMVKRPFNDASAQELIRKISQTAYDHFNQPGVSPRTSSMPSDSTATGSRDFALDNYGQ